LKELKAARELGLPISVHLSRAGDQAIRMFDALISRRLLGPDMQVVHATNARPDQLAALNRAGASLALTPLTEHRGLRADPALAVRQREAARPRHRRHGVGGRRRHVRNDAPGGAHRHRRRTRRDGGVATPAVGTGHPRGRGVDRHGADVGTITKGKWADLQVIDTKALGLAPFIDEDPVALIVYSARPEHVHAVLVGGQIVKDEGRLVNVDTTAIVRALKSSARALGKRDVP
jgi:cytosine/adenosine deaminase-related metal-dependent hydrolase